MRALKLIVLALLLSTALQANATNATTNWVLAIPVGVGGVIDPKKGEVRYYYSTAQPTVKCSDGRPIKWVDSQEWGLAPNNIWVCKTSSAATKYQLNLYTD
jgi:hypothetical protein